MIDFENEFLKIKKIAYQLTEKTYGKLVAELHMAGFDQQKELFEMFFKSGAESKQAEIDSLKAQLAKVERGELVLVPKEPTEDMIKHAYGTYEGANILPYSFYKAMIEAAQENSHE
ncbi:hypothetical protein [uncultured Acinetobacter sp.]|uniref:hypothetical protein n=1 Tax=uncultured Acinetobacter sp. TaxID=165433 RepID=UPI0037478C4F